MRQDVVQTQFIKWSFKVRTEFTRGIGQPNKKQLTAQKMTRRRVQKRRCSLVVSVNVKLRMTSPNVGISRAKYHVLRDDTLLVCPG